MGRFVADLEDIITVSEERMLMVMRQSIADVIDDAQMSTGKGGRMRVDTGFLRASGQISLTGMPSGPGRGESKEKYYYDDGNSLYSDTLSIATVIGEHASGLQLGATIFFGWMANYAIYREAYDGFLEGALQNWSKIVAKNTEEIRKRITTQ